MADNGDRDDRSRRRKPPLTRAALRELALAYVARFATSGGKLQRYLDRKLFERGWDDEGAPDCADLVREFAALGYVDDAGFARMRGDALLRRGMGARRVAQALGEAGIARQLVEKLAPDAATARAAALRLAQRRRFGPFGAAVPDRAAREKQVAAMLRAGHPLDFARNLVDAASQAAAFAWAGDTDGESDVQDD